MWCIAELGLPVQRLDIGHKYGGNDTAEFLAMNPNGKVPVLRDGDDAPLWESGAILRYLGSRYGDAPFWPKDVAQRAQIDKWAEWAKLNVAMNFSGPIFWRVVRTAPEDVDQAVVAQAIAALGRQLDIAEAQIADHPFLAGDDFTLADIQFGHLLYRYFDMPITRPEHPAIRRYYQALIDRPAFRDNVMVPYGELRPA